MAGLVVGLLNYNATLPGNLSVGGTSSFTGAATFDGGAFFPDNDTARFGNTNASPDASIGFNTAQTADTLVIGLGADSNGVVFCQQGDVAFDFAHADATNPTVFVHSAAQSTSEWGSLKHTGSYFTLNTGGGGIHLAPANGTVLLNDDVQFTLGSGADATLRYSTVQTVDNLLLSVGADGNALILCQQGDVAFDFAHAQATDPTLFIHSSAQSTSQWIGITHNGTNGVITPGTGGVQFGGHQLLPDDTEMRFGIPHEASLNWNTAQTPDSLTLGLSATSNALVVCELADRGFDFAHALQTNPTLFIHSANQNTTQWISLTHDGTNGIIDVGTGTIKLLDMLQLSSTYAAGITVATGTVQMKDATGTTYNVLCVAA